MPYLSPPTLTGTEVESLLAVTRSHPRDHLIIALALGTGLCLGEIVKLNVGDVYLPDGTGRTRVRLRAEVAKGGRIGDTLPAGARGRLDPLPLRPIIAKWGTFGA